MAFRDDREALRARIAALESELSEADSENARIAAERDAAIRKLARIEAGEELEEPGEPEAPEEEADSQGAATEGILDPEGERPGTRPHADAEGSSLDEVLSREEKKRGSGGLSGVPVGCWIGALAGVLPLVLAAWSFYIDLSIDRPTTAEWRGEVLASEGQAPEVGETCVTRARLRGDGEARFRVDHLHVRCGGREVYDWDDDIDALDGEDAPDPRQRCGRLLERAEPGARYRYVLQCEDIGGREGGRPELGLDTEAGLLNLWRDTPPIFRLRIRLDRESRPARGGPILGSSGEGRE